MTEIKTMEQLLALPEDALLLDGGRRIVQRLGADSKWWGCPEYTCRAEILLQYFGPLKLIAPLKDLPHQMDPKQGTVIYLDLASEGELFDQAA